MERRQALQHLWLGGARGSALGAQAMGAIPEGDRMVERDLQALVRQAVEEIWNQGELAVADTLFAPDYVNHAGLIADLVRGPEAIKISVAFYRIAFPDIHISIDTLTANEDAVLLRWTARSTKAQGTLSGMLVSRVAGGKIAESWMQWDQAGMRQRLCLPPLHAPGSACPVRAQPQRRSDAA